MIVPMTSPEIEEIRKGVKLAPQVFYVVWQDRGDHKKPSEPMGLGAALKLSEALSYSEPRFAVFVDAYDNKAMEIT